MKIFAIETSCDDTGIAIMEWPSFAKASEGKLLSNIVSSQVKIHAPYGGVVPNLAQRAHQENLVPILEMALQQVSSIKYQVLSINNKIDTIKNILQREPVLLDKTLDFLNKYEKPDIDLISVTYGPGLAPCLWVGVNFAKALAYAWDLPVVPVNHIEAHIAANWLPIGENMQLLTKNYKLPTLCLVVSGGHTQLILMKEFKKYEIIGETKDDAAGEAFDKVAKLLNLSYPGGPAIAEQAEQWKSQITNHKLQINSKSQIQNSKQGAREELSTIKFPRPMINTKDFDFSFSGLKTAVLYFVKKNPHPSPLPVGQGEGEIMNAELIGAICAEFEQAVVDVLVKKTMRAAEKYSAKTIMLSGGVSANDLLRSSLKNEAEKMGLEFIAPAKQFCSDNAGMVALAGYWHRSKAKKAEDINAEANLRIN